MPEEKRLMLKKEFAMLAVLLTLLFAGVAAAEEYRLKRQDAGPQAASGTAILEEYGSVDCDRLLKVTVFGLKPDSVYSVWIVEKNGEKAAAGINGKNTFKTGPSGEGNYTYYSALAYLYWHDLRITEGPGYGTVALSAWMRP